MRVQDLVSAGYAGLVDAFRRVETDQCDNVAAYLDHRIRGAMLDELRSHDRLTRDQRRFARRLAAVNQQLPTKLGRAPNESEVADALGLEVAVLRERMAWVHLAASRSDASAIDQAADVSGDERDRPDVLCETRERHSALAAALGRLSERERAVLQRSFDDGQTLRQIGDALGVTESRVCQIRAEAIAKLRGLVSND